MFGADVQHVQDLEEDRLTLMKDIIWAYANAISQVCVEDDGVSRSSSSVTQKLMVVLRANQREAGDFRAAK